MSVTELECNNKPTYQLKSLCSCKAATIAVKVDFDRAKLVSDQYKIDKSKYETAYRDYYHKKAKWVKDKQAYKEYEEGQVLKKNCDMGVQKCTGDEEQIPGKDGMESCHSTSADLAKTGMRNVCKYTKAAINNKVDAWQVQPENKMPEQPLGGKADGIYQDCVGCLSQNLPKIQCCTQIIDVGGATIDNMSRISQNCIQEIDRVISGLEKSYLILDTSKDTSSKDTPSGDTSKDTPPKDPPPNDTPDESDDFFSSNLFIIIICMVISGVIIGGWMFFTLVVGFFILQ